MSQNAAKFDKLLKSKNIELEKIVNEESTTFLVRENIENVGMITVGILFNSNDGIVNIVAYQYLRIDKPEQKQRIMELINTLNIEYTFCKFTEKDDLVTLQISAPFKDNFSAELIMELIFYVLKAIQEEHPRFMAILG